MLEAGNQDIQKDGGMIQALNHRKAEAAEESVRGEHTEAGGCQIIGLLGLLNFKNLM